MALPLLLSLVAVRGSATLKLQGNDKGQIQFEPTGAAKLMGDERSINPFLRADDPAMQAAVGMAGGDPSAVFAEIRKRKDNF